MSQPEIEIPDIVEPSLKLAKPSLFRKGYWGVQETFGVDTSESKEAFQAKLFTQAIKAYRDKVTEFQSTVESLKDTYDKMTSAFLSLESKKREAIQVLSEKYTINPHRLWISTDEENPSDLELSAEEIEPTIGKLRIDLETICSTDSDEFEKTCHTTPRDYISTCESVLSELEQRLLKITEARVDIETTDISLQTLWGRRKIVYDLYKKSLSRLRSYENFIQILEIDGVARSQIIQSAVQSNKLEIGADLLLKMYRSLEASERGAARELSTSLDPHPISRLEEAHQQAELAIQSMDEVDLLLRRAKNPESSGGDAIREEGHQPAELTIKSMDEVENGK